VQQSFFGEANLAEADCTGAVFSGAILQHATAPGARFRDATLVTMFAPHADLSECDFTGAKLSVVTFKRATLARAVMLGTTAENADFEYADLREARISKSSFTFSNFVGAEFAGARAGESSFFGADLFWTTPNGLQHIECDFESARMPEAVRPAFGTVAPAVQPKPLYRSPATPAERHALVALAAAPNRS